MLYKIERSNPEVSSRIEIKSPASFGLKEGDIENFLKSRLSEIVSADHLMLIGQERAFQEEADLLALDEKGVLYIFELKRWQSQSENILQVMRYGQKFGRYDYDELESLAKRQENLEGSLQEAHRVHFNIEEPLQREKFNHNQVFVLVTNGTDADTISAIDYWSKKGVRIECSPYRIYNIEGDPYIQFDTYNPEGDVIVEGSAKEGSTKYVIVNTNITYMENAWRDMLGDRKKGKASAYGNRRYAIADIPKGSTVYLYHTRVGVIAKGITTSAYIRNDENAEYYVPLDFQRGWVLDESQWEAMAPKAREINKKLDASHRFRHTVLWPEETMIEAIDSIYDDKCAQQVARSSEKDFD